MGRKKASVTNAISSAHETWLNDQASLHSSTIKTTVFIKPRTDNQARFVKSIKDQRNTVIIGAGLSGSGKSLLALFTAIQMLNNPELGYRKIVYVRANVGTADERELGALPGSLQDKTSVLAYPVLDNLIEFMDEPQANYFLNESGKIEVTTMSYLRGRSFSHSILLLDETQNASINGVKTFLTRIGENSKAILIGDTAQVDLKNSMRPLSGLSDAIQRFDNLDGVEIIQFGKEDCQRNPIIPHILERYEDKPNLQIVA